MITKGFKFGMMLQLAVGPLCLLVFKSAGSGGFGQGLLVMTAVALVDAFYITLAAAGAAKFLQNGSMKNTVKIIGGLILIFFGLDIPLGILGFSILPGFRLFQASGTDSVFVKGLLMTASNPLTILFWSGVLSGEIVENKLTKRQVFEYGCGCVLSTVFFMSLIAFAGSVVGTFLPDFLIKFLNFAIGLVIAGYGVKLLTKKV